MPMSHFLTLVLIPGNTPMNRVERFVEDMLEPYSQYLEVDVHEEECGCVGFHALRDVQAELANIFNVEALRLEFTHLPEDEQTEAHWKQMIAPIEKKRYELLAAHPLANKPAPDCDECNGTGIYLSQCNPDTRWDWWVIGGRWDGYLFGPKQQEASCDKEGGFNFGDEHHTPENNCRPVAAIPIDDTHYVPFAILTPENEWVEQGEMGMWANVSNEKDFAQWHGIVKDVLAKYPEHLAVAVDCHI